MTEEQKPDIKDGPMVILTESVRKKLIHNILNYM